MTVDQHACLLFLDHEYMHGQLPHQCRQLRQNNLAPKSSCRHSFSFDQDRFGLYELYFYPLCSQPLGQLRTSGELISACGHDPAGDALPKSGYLFDERTREKHIRDVSETARKVLSHDISVSKPHDTCIPTLSDFTTQAHWRCKFSGCNIKKFLNNLEADVTLAGLQSGFYQFPGLLPFCWSAVIKGIYKHVGVHKKFTAHSFHPLKIFARHGHRPSLPSVGRTRYQYCHD